MYRVTGQEDGWKIGWTLSGVMVLSAKSTRQVLIRGGPLGDQYCDQYYLASSLVTWMMG